MDAAQERFERANRLFSDALNQPKERRLEFITANCTDDPSIGESVLRLLTKFDDLGDFLERPVGTLSPDRPSLPAGTVLANRFRIEALAGRGGMGEVYRARDLSLEDTVAVKIIRSEWRFDPAVLARFRDEIRLTRRISSDHVCKVFDLFTGVDENGLEMSFFTMDYLEGETLSGILARHSPLDKEWVLKIAAGIAEGLDSAHRHGIIHRDLKPSNIIIVCDERPVITDFGLAKCADTPSGSVTQAGTLVGSPNYMAPEQFLGEVLTPAADLFALGVILYEMVAGTLPYPPESIIRAAVRRLTDAPIPLLQAAPGAPRHWESALQCAMHRWPARRYASARHLIEELKGPPSAMRRVIAPLRLIRPSRRSLAVGAGAAVLLSCSVEFLRLHRRALPSAPLLMLMPIACPSSPETARSLAIQLEKGMIQSAHVAIVGNQEIVQTWKLMGNAIPLPARLEMSAAREIAMRCGANFVLSGDLGQVGGEWIFTVRLEVMGNSTSHPQEKFSSHFYAPNDDGLLGAGAEAVNWVRRAAGESATELHSRSRPAEEVTTRSWEALKEFAAAKDAWSARPVDHQWPPDQTRAAEVHLQRALELDPDFAIAASLLADIQVASQQFDEGLRTYQKAAQLISKRNLSDRETLLIWGLFDLDTGQFASAEQVFARYALQYPKDALPLFYESRAVENQGQLEAAVHLLDLALRKEPSSYTYLMNRAIRNLDLGRLGEAENDLKRGAAMNPGDWTHHVRSTLAFARFDAPGVWHSLEEMRTSGSVAYRSKAYVLEACFRAEQGRLEDSEILLRQGMQFDTENRLPIQTQVVKRRHLAQVFLQRGDRRQAAACARQILEQGPGLRSVLDAGAVLAQAGDTEAAQRCLPAHLPKAPPGRLPETLPDGAAPELLAWPIYWRRVARLWAEIALVSGNAQNAYDLLDQAPRGETLMEWPDALIRASIACGRHEKAATLLRSLFANPASYWLPVDISGPGFMRRAVLQSAAIGIPARESGALSRFLA